MGDAFVVGAGMTRFGRFPERRLEDLGFEAVVAALDDAGVAPSAVQAAYCGNCLGGGNPAQRILAEVGLSTIPALTIDNACASGSTAFSQACLAVTSGVHDVVLAIGAEQMSRSIRGLIDTASLGTWDTTMGLVNPGAYALIAQRHMHEHGTTLEQLASVAVKAHRHGSRNERAQFRSRGLRRSRPARLPRRLRRPRHDARP